MMLMVRYDARPVIPVEEVRRDFFAAYTPLVFLRKLGNGEIALPLVRFDESQKGPKGIPLMDLAAYIDQRIEVARKEAAALQT